MSGSTITPGRTAWHTAAVAQFRALAGPRRFRVVPDAEGLPVLPGRGGRVEWYDGTDLAVSSARPRLFRALLAVPGARRHQTADREIRVLVPPEALQAVAGLLRLRRRRSAVSAAHLQAVRRPPYRSTSAA